jgi:hypothetical protein
MSACVIGGRRETDRVVEVPSKFQRLQRRSRLLLTNKFVATWLLLLLLFLFLGGKEGDS